MVAYVAQVGSPQQRIGYGMYEHVGIAVSEQSKAVLYPYSAQYQVASFNKAVNIEAHAYAKTHVVPFHFLNKSLIPSMSKPSVKRSVWSSGLLLAVAMTYPASSEKTLMRKPAPTVKYFLLPLFSDSWW